MPKKERVSRTANRLTRADKIAKRLRGVSASTGFKRKSATFTFRVLAIQPVEITGFIVESNKHSVLFRHKRTNASKRMVVSRFDRSEIVELFGEPGELSSITVMREVPVREVIGTIIEDSDGVVSIKTPSGETVRLFMNSNVRIEVSAEDDAAVTEGKSKKSSGKSKKSAPEKTVKKKSKRKSDVDDDDLD
jgi:hypothetical protein